MQHPEPDDLALLALGESLGDAVDAHVATCAACTSEIESFRMTVGLADLSNFGEDAQRPGEHVWAAIASELGFASTGRSSGSVATAIGEAGQTAETYGTGESSYPPVGSTYPLAGLSGPPAQEPAVPAVPQSEGPQGPNGSQGLNGSRSPNLRAVPGTGSPASDSSASSPGSAGMPPTAAESRATPNRRWSRWTAPLAAAVVGIAVGAGAVVLSQSTSDDVTIEAIAPLKPVADGPLGGDSGTLGEAELVAVTNGQQVRVTADQLPPSTNAYEVWLFGDDGRMVSLGTLNDRSGSFTVPQGINTQEYRVVDVSDEAPDGNPAHSGVSLIRGEFS